MLNFIRLRVYYLWQSMQSVVRQAGQERMASLAKFLVELFFAFVCNCEPPSSTDFASRIVDSIRFGNSLSSRKLLRNSGAFHAHWTKYYNQDGKAPTY